MRIAIINGANLNRLGTRKVDVYGAKTMAQILLDIQQQYPDLYLTYKQSNHEGDLVDWLQELGEEVDGIVLNAGGYAHTSVVIRDAIEDCAAPVVEVHISNIYQREDFRKHSMLTDVCAHNIIGIGTDCYVKGVEWIINEKNN